MRFTGATRGLMMLMAMLSFSLPTNSHADESEADRSRFRRLEPSTPWNLDYAEKSCVLKRAFSDGTRSVTLEIRKYAPVEWLQVGVASQDMRFKSVGPRVPAASFLPDPDVENFPNMHRVAFGEHWQGVVWADMLRLNGHQMQLAENPDGPGSLPEWTEAEHRTREASITGILLTNAFTEDVELITGPLNGAMDAMRHCENDLLKERGMDPQVYRSLTRKAQPEDFRALSRRIQQRYPSAMIARGQMGRIHIRASVDASGEVTGCEQLGILGQGNFAEIACHEIMRNTRFESALDASGKPVASDWYGNITYYLR